MKSIRTILFAMVMAMSAIACEELEGDINGEDTPNESSVTLEFTEKKISFSEQSFTVKVSGTDEWSVTMETPVNWCSVKKENSTSATISVSGNDEYESRSVTFIFTCGEATARLTVIQDEKREFLLSETNFEIGSEGGSISIPLQANVDYSCNVDEACKDWIALTQTKALEESQIVLTVSKNETPNERVGTVEISYGEKKETVTITQSQLDELIMETKEFEIDSEGGEISIPISTNIDYTVEMEEDASLWINVKELKTKSLEDCMLIIEISRNSGDERVGVLNIIGENINESVTITQSGARNDVIYYTSSDGQVVTPCNPDAFGANITSNEYVNGRGMIQFDGDVTEIGECAFEDCGTMTSVTIPSSVTFIGMEAFWECTSLTSIEIPSSVTSIDPGVFLFCPNLAAFYSDFASDDHRCLIIDGELISFAPAGLTEYTIPDSVTSIAMGAFSTCTELVSIHIPNSVTSIGEEAFSGCTSLTSIEIPSSVTSIEDAAFYGCSSLSSIEIPDSVNSIGEVVFVDCPKLTAFTGKYASADNRCLIIDGVLASFAPAGLTEYTIPDSVTTIGRGTFGDCTELTSIKIPNSVTLIEEGVFEGCTGLTSVKISDSVTSIGGLAFYGCSSLTTIDIPSSVTSIGNYAFSDCTSLASAYCRPTIPPTAGMDIFGVDIPNLRIYVPSASASAYKAADGWSYYANKIAGIL